MMKIIAQCECIGPCFVQTQSNKQSIDPNGKLIKGLGEESVIACEECGTEARIEWEEEENPAPE